MSVIWFMLFLHIVMHNICLFECQLVLTNDLEITRFYDIHALMLLYWQAYCGFYLTQVSKTRGCDIRWFWPDLELDSK